MPPFHNQTYRSLMKGHLLFFFVTFLCGIAVPANAQTLVDVRYYFDGNEGSAQFLTLPAVTDVDQPIELDISGLSKGVHRLYLEVRNVEGKWSLYDSDLLQVEGGTEMATLNAFEYFYDNDPGMGEGIQVALASNSIDNFFDISVEGLSNGMHMLYMRTRDASGQWSLYANRLVQVTGAGYEEIVEAEYFFNDDPGFGNGTPIALNDFTVNDLFDIDLAGLPRGLHKLYLRVRDSRVQWSLYASENIQVEGGTGFHELITGEYYFDSDPGFGNGFPIDIPEGITSIDDLVEINVPAGLSNGSHKLYVRVRDGSGQWSLYASKNINVCNIVLPQITLTGNPCSDEAITLTAPPGYLTYSWSNGEGGTSTQVSESGTYFLTVTDADCAAATSVEVEFDIYDAPQIEVSGNQCEGQLQVLAASGGYDTYLWSNGLTSQQINVTQPGTYSLVATINGCELTNTVDVNVVENPTPEISSTGNACVGNAVSLDAGSGYDSYLWSNDNVSQQISVTGSGTYSVTVINDGCEGTDDFTIEFDTISIPEILVEGQGVCEGDINTLSVPAVYDSYLWTNDSNANSILVTSGGTYGVTVNNGDCSAFAFVELEYSATPDVEITVSGSQCLGQTQLLEVTSGYAGYEWNTGALTSQISVTAPGIYNVIVSNGNCESESDVEVMFYAQPDAQISGSGGNCEGDVVVLSVQAGALLYEWSTGASSNTINVTVGGWYSVEVANGNCVATNDTLVQFTPSPVVNITSTGGSCAGDSQQLDAGPGYDTYEWNTDETTQVIEVSTGGTYSVLVSENGCTGDDDVDVSFYFVPTPLITQNGNTLSCVQSGFIYQWYFEGFPIAGATLQSYDATENGTYTVVITMNGCDATSLPWEFVYIGLSEGIRPEIVVGPNPAEDELMISSLSDPEFSIALYDLTGKSILHTYVSNGKATLSTGSIAAGSYFLVCNGLNWHLITRVVVMH